LFGQKKNNFFYLCQHWVMGV